MGFVVAGPNTKVLASQFDLSPFFSSVSLPTEVSTADTTSFGKSAHCHTPILKDATVSFGGFYDAASRTVFGSTVLDSVDVVLAAALGSSSSRLITVALDGMTIGNVVRLIHCLESSYEISGEVEGVVEVSAEMQASQDAAESGVSLAEPILRTGSGNGTSVDSGAATTNGGVAHLHSLVGGTGNAGGTVDVKIQHSVDNSVWVDLVVFTTLSRTGGEAPIDASGAERLAVTGTVNRYLRAVWTHTSGSTIWITAAVAFARR